MGFGAKRGTTQLRVVISDARGQPDPAFTSFTRT